MVLDPESQTPAEIGLVGTFVGLCLAVGFALLSGSISPITSGLLFFVPAGLILALLLANFRTWSQFLADLVASGPARPEYDGTRSNPTQELTRLRQRYVSGELSDEQFERKLQLLLNTETLEESREYVQRETEQ
ncbi:hypothetical protein AUR64_00045 [Haloprofundus marisrubri]|uniref:SHOCT domain-containing protein n=1 Tax=Haloprofundus marisrubri TaxID=1514971 RepID=A0A0W1RD41_9EURY|nr:SHOCT domain-containing protein [Haloprofundus marisrubri]KTG11621.1 hypothetical protein AUR64_00045 [Haloprofundus marisrubri]